MENKGYSKEELQEFIYGYLNQTSSKGQKQDDVKKEINYETKLEKVKKDIGDGDLSYFKQYFEVVNGCEIRNKTIFKFLYLDDKLFRQYLKLRDTNFIQLMNNIKDIKYDNKLDYLNDLLEIDAILYGKLKVGENHRNIPPLKRESLDGLFDSLINSNHEKILAKFIYQVLVYDERKLKMVYISKKEEYRISPEFVSKCKQYIAKSKNIQKCIAREIFKNQDDQLDSIILKIVDLQNRSMRAQKNLGECKEELNSLRQNFDQLEKDFITQKNMNTEFSNDYQKMKESNIQNGLELTKLRNLSENLRNTLEMERSKTDDLQFAHMKHKEEWQEHMNELLNEQDQLNLKIEELVTKKCDCENEIADLKSSLAVKDAELNNLSNEKELLTLKGKKDVLYSMVAHFDKQIRSISSTIKVIENESRDPKTKLKSLKKMIEDIDVLLEDNGIDKIGEINEVIGFDPMFHQCDNGDLGCGDLVKIIKVGRKFTNNDEIITKAVVLPVDGE